MIETRTSFVFETTLSSQHSINLMRSAKAAGFSVDLYYTALNSVESNIERVRQRVEAGGHDIPEADIRRRYAGSFSRLAAALKHADEALLIDNSGLEPRVVMRVNTANIETFDIEEKSQLHQLFVAKVCAAYGLVRTPDGFKRIKSFEQEF